MRVSPMALFLGAGLLLGCSGGGQADPYADDALLDEVVEPGKVDGYFNIPFATFRAVNTPKEGQFRLLANTASGIAYREVATACEEDTCEGEGRELMVLWSRSGSTSYVRFLDDAGELVDRYAFELKEKNTILRLRKAGGGAWQELALSDDAWCAAEGKDVNDRTDCSDQSDTPAAAGTWTCKDNHCVRKVDYDACLDAKGECVNAGSCAQELVGDALKYPCEGEGVCCFPGSTEPAFEPLDPDNVRKAWDVATQKAGETLHGPNVFLLVLKGKPSADGPSYAALTFDWAYHFVARSEDAPAAQITVSYPGWKATKVSGLPTGAYLSQERFDQFIKLTFGELVAAIAADDVTMSTCPLGTGEVGGFVDLKGVFGGGGTRWFWEFFCGGNGTYLKFDAGSGEAIE